MIAMLEASQLYQLGRKRRERRLQGLKMVREIICILKNHKESYLYLRMTAYWYAEIQNETVNRDIHIELTLSIYITNFLR